MMRERLFGAMAASAIILNALYIVANIFLSPFGVQYPLFHFNSLGALILAAFLYGPAIIAAAIWMSGHFGKSHAAD
jgi:hypothetical protein